MRQVAATADSGQRDRGESRAPNFITRLIETPRRWGKFLHEVRVEMTKVTWPSRHDVFTTTSVVIATVAFFGVFFFFVDSGASWIMQHALNLFKH